MVRARGVDPRPEPPLPLLPEPWHRDCRRSVEVLATVLARDAELPDHFAPPRHPASAGCPRNHRRSTRCPSRTRPGPGAFGLPGSPRRGSRAFPRGGQESACAQQLAQTRKTLPDDMEPTSRPGGGSMHGTVTGVKWLAAGGGRRPGCWTSRTPRGRLRPAVPLNRTGPDRRSTPMEGRRDPYQFDVGSATVEPKTPVTVGSWYTRTIIITAGEFGSDEGSRFLVCRRLSCDMELPQFGDPRSPRLRDGILFEPGRDGGALRHRPGLPRRLAGGDRRADRPRLSAEGGSPHRGHRRHLGRQSGPRAQTFPEKRHTFKVVADVFNINHFYEIADSPEIEVVPGEPARIELACPQTPLAGEPFDLVVRVTDDWGNPVRRYSGTIRFSDTAGCPPPPAGDARERRRRGHARRRRPRRGPRSTAPGRLGRCQAHRGQPARSSP